MKRVAKKFWGILIRYSILVIITIPNLWLFYLIFLPLTIYPSYFLFSLFFNASMNGQLITLDNCFPIEFIGACVAGSAYYLLLILNLSVPDIKIKKRLTMILFSFLILLIINIMRIFILGLLFASRSSVFDITHKFFWYLMSVLFVAGIWFAEVKLFRIKKIPLYSDLRFLYKNSIMKK